MRENAPLLRGGGGGGEWALLELTDALPLHYSLPHSRVGSQEPLIIIYFNSHCMLSFSSILDKKLKFK